MVPTPVPNQNQNQLPAAPAAVQPTPTPAAPTPPAPTLPPALPAADSAPAPTPAPLSGPRILGVRSSLTTVRNIQVQRLVIDLSGPATYSARSERGGLTLFLPQANAAPACRPWRAATP